MAMNNNGAGGVQGLRLISMTRQRSVRRPAENDHAVVNLGAVAPFPGDGDSLPFTVGDSNPGKMKNLPPSSASPHEIGQDPWWVVGFNLVAASSSSYILSYPQLIMTHLGWIAGPIIMVLLNAVFFYNNCLLGSLHETGGKRQIRTRDLVGYIYGRRMFTAVWILQFTVLIVFCIGTFIWAGTTLEAIYASYSSDPSKISLSEWVAIAGACYSVFAFVVPTLHSLRLYSTISLGLTMIITFITIGISIKDGVKSGVARDYSIVGTKADKWFSAMGALSVIGFAFNTAILPELQADVRPPTARNIYKALGLQYTLGAIPIIGLTLIGYWAYGNVVSGFILESNSGPKWLVTVAKVAAFFQILVTLHIYALPMFEFFDSKFLKARRNLKPSGNVENDVLQAGGHWSARTVLVRFLTRITFISITTLLGAMFPFFGDILELSGAVIVFPIDFGLVHHMYLKVKGKNFSLYRRTWHWLMIVTAVLLTIASVTGASRNIIAVASTYRIFHSKN
ncbi:unnamed protein product [Sphagnum troendelagicum]|uniref:Amino acid transporter transmembrane domain-containing protein n=1 Tax=Sphagnum troendelagicum TaxID=128251 RepID=A0ABP0TR94_9BRYO